LADKRLEDTGQKQADWRTDPARSGAGGCIGDIGTHAYNLADVIVGVPSIELCADLSTFVEGRRLDDNARFLAALCQWRARNAVGEPSRARQRQRPADPRLPARRAACTGARPDPDTLFWSPFGQPHPNHHARRPRREAGSRPRHAESRRATPRAIFEAFATL
jgi:hypothetical protein